VPNSFGQKALAEGGSSRHCPVSALAAEVRLTVFSNLHFTSSQFCDQQPPPPDGLALIYDYLHRRLEECFVVFLKDRR